MARAGGNKIRCKTCGGLAASDGFCKRHRPERKHQAYVRDNFIDDNFLTKGKDFHQDSYGCVRETFPCVKEGY